MATPDTLLLQNMTLPNLFFDLRPGKVKTHCSPCDGEKYKDTKDALLFL